MNKFKKQAEATKTVVTPTDKAQTTALTVLKSGDNPKAEDTASEVVEPAKPGLNLAKTLELVEELYNKKRHRDRLEMSIDELESFEISRKNEDLDDQSYYNGCQVTIKDDKSGSFTTKNPAIVREVAKYLKQKFTEKLTEIEASIVLP